MSFDAGMNPNTRRRGSLSISLGRWAALTRYIDDGELPIDNNHVENRIRPVARGRSSWLFAGSLRAGQRAANVMSLVQSVKLNGHDPYRYLKDVFRRLPTQPASRLAELLPQSWSAARAHRAEILKFRQGRADVP